jgi:hypothetical protein
MLELVNFSDTAGDLAYLLSGQPHKLPTFLAQNGLDGVELMLTAPWNGTFPQQSYIKGIHLRFWPCWLDFWRDDRPRLEQTFCDDEALRREFGCSQREAWLEIFRQNIRAAVATGAPYFVFHVTNMRPPELATREFADTDQEVMDAAADFINLFSDEIPADRLLLFENLWWAGLTLRNGEAALHLLERVHHKKCGFMFDTGHMMASEMNLANEADGIDFLLRQLDRLGPVKQYIRGMHLHRSLTSSYVCRMLNGRRSFSTMAEALEYTLRADQHEPFASLRARELVDVVQPEYLVHEFVPKDYADWCHKVQLQRRAIGRL